MGGRHFLKAFSAVTAVCVLVACGSTPKPPPPLAQDVRSSLTTVGVITSGPPIGGKVDAPVGVGKQAVVGFIEGGGIGAAGGAGAGALAGLFCGPAAPLCVPVGAIFGAGAGLIGGSAYGSIAGGVNAIPESTAGEIQTALLGAISDRDLQADLRERVLRRTGNAMGVDLGVGAIEPVALPDYSSFNSRGVGTVLEMSLTQVAFAGKGGRNPTLTLVMTARARLIRIGDKRVLWDVKEMRFESSPAAFSLWAGRDSDLLKAEIDNGLDSLARQMGEALFIAPGTPVRPL
jgi:hypothetical protein